MWAIPCVEPTAGKPAGPWDALHTASHAGSIKELAIRFTMFLHHAVVGAPSQRTSITMDLNRQDYCGLAQCVLRPNHQFIPAWPHAMAALDRERLKLSVDQPVVGDEGG